MKYPVLLGSVLLLGAFSVQAKEAVTLKVGQSQEIKYIGKMQASCGENATIKVSSGNIVTHGGALDSNDKAFLIAGEFIKRFSPLPTKVTVECIGSEEARSQRVSAQVGANNQQDYQDFQEINNQYWECTPGGLLGSTNSRNYSAKSCNRDEAMKASQFKCYQNDRFGMNGCEKPVTCYVVKMDSSLMCDHIMPDQYGNYTPYPHSK